MQALVLAGGKGTRLYPYTTVLPKPLMPVGDYPILEILLRQLKAAGITEVILAVGYLSHLIEAFFQNGERLGLKISYSLEEKPLGTAGPISLVLDRLEQDFLILNGDLLTTMRFGNLIQYHKANQAAATIGLYQREVKIDFGVIETNDQSQLLCYREKPVYHFDVSMGVNVLNKQKILPYLKPGEYLDIPELMMQLSQNQHPVYCYREPCYWLDIGRVDDYQVAVSRFVENPEEFIPSGL
ncbi:MAG: nucleoside-diphosphate-sugar pyrophosphorylase [Alkalinema sp. CACIAM 70d]|uniref:sugar phosphate nucleotidyltransferase n=1 Tax=Alkalinema pantanalense TaxID=1620705 RepID=UPI000B6764AE|nr:MAG: nucleoside-diphosphate-sugar pyrophosphorylase [Alkalinema sp. CACIAM 70d]